MIKLTDFSNHMMKSSFDIPNPIMKKPKKYIIVQDNLFFALYSKKNNVNPFTLTDYNDMNEKIKIAECLEKLKFKNKEDIINNLVYEKTINLDTLNITMEINSKEQNYINLISHPYNQIHKCNIHNEYN